MTNEQQERLRQIREQRRRADVNMRDLGRYNGQDASWADIDFLLSLLDSQEVDASYCLDCGAVISSHCMKCIRSWGNE